MPGAITIICSRPNQSRLTPAKKSAEIKLGKTVMTPFDRPITRAIDVNPKSPPIRNLRPLNGSLIIRGVFCMFKIKSPL